MSDHEDRLRATLLRLETSAQKIIKTRGYTQDVKALRTLAESIREQLINANASYPTRPIR